MSCDLPAADIYECDFCRCQFEAGVAGVSSDGEPRCPECGAFVARPVPPEHVRDFVVMRWSGFG